MSDLRFITLISLISISMLGVDIILGMLFGFITGFVLLTLLIEIFLSLFVLVTLSDLRSITLVSQISIAMFGVDIISGMLCEFIIRVVLLSLLIEIFLSLFEMSFIILFVLVFSNLSLITLVFVLSMVLQCSFSSKLHLVYLSKKGLLFLFVRNFQIEFDDPVSVDFEMSYNGAIGTSSVKEANQIFSSLSNWTVLTIC